MDGIIDHETLSYWLMNYGSIGLFVLLALGILILPVPEETMMVLSGILMYNHSLNIPSTIIAAYLGSMTGITLSYLLGRTAGHYLLVKVTGWFGVSEHHMKTAHNWFEKYGKWALMFGYFIPGVRHFTGVSAGTAELEYRSFALFAYTGAVFWASTFLSIGYFFGDYFLKVYHHFHFHLDDVLTLVILAGIVVLVILLKKKVLNF